MDIGNMLVNCSKCRTPLQLPPAAGSIRCVLCNAVSQVTYPYAPLPSSPYNHVQPCPTLNPHSCKKAVIVGISYRHSPFELKESFRYAMCMRNLLIKKFSFPESSIYMLTEKEDPRGPYFPIKRNIEMAMRWLVQECQSGDSLVFYFIGHGSQQKNLTGDEVDGYDETLLPLDYKTNGMIVDDDINAMIVRPLPVGVRLHALIDASHRGTILDLPFLYKMKRSLLCKMKRSKKYEWEDHRPRSGTWKGTSGGEVICFSGCHDDETYDNTALQSKMKSTGAMTICFIHAVEKGDGASYGDIFAIICDAIRNPDNRDITNGDRVKLFLAASGGILSLAIDGGLIVGTALAILAAVPSPVLSNIWDSSLGKLCGRRQTPQLTVSELFDVNEKAFWM